MRLPRDVILHIEAEEDGTVNICDYGELTRCEECKYNPVNPRYYYDDDKVEMYWWCDEFIKTKGYCSFGKHKP